jgi:uncharacterized protein (DUF1810 family)
MDLTRFVAAQQDVYPAALAELRAGRKTSHWMWFVFPQIAGLGHSQTARFYAIASRAEARSYLADPLLGSRLADCVSALMRHPDRSAEAILGAIDAMKLRSSMTLFAAVADDPAPFLAVLDTFCGGVRDPATLTILEGQAG